MSFQPQRNVTLLYFLFFVTSRIRKHRYVAPGLNGRMCGQKKCVCFFLSYYYFVSRVCVVLEIMFFEKLNLRCDSVILYVSACAHHRYIIELRRPCCDRHFSPSSKQRNENTFFADLVLFILSD